MTTGSRLQDWSIPSSPYTYFYKYVASPTWTASGGGSSINVGRYFARNWSGTNRPSLVGTSPRSKGSKRYYTVPETRISRSGKKYTKLVTRSFWTNMPRKKLRSGRDEEHAYSVTWQRDDLPVGGSIKADSYSLGSVYFQERYDNASYRQWNSAGNIPTAVFDANAQIKLVGKLREQVEGGEFNLSVFLGEGHQTLNMIGSTATKLATAYTAFRKGNVQKAANILVHGTKPSRVPRKRHAAGSSWLELQYGWMPLLGDMRAGAEKLANYMYKPFVQRYRTRHTVKVTPAQFAASRTDVCTFAMEKSLYRRQYIAIVSEPPSVAQLSGILDPELVLWELTPFSFVVDWFYPFGAYLEARAFESKKLIRDLTQTDTIIRERTGLKTVVKNPGLSQVVYYGGSGGFESSGSSTRTIHASLPSISLPNVKSLSEALSFRHCMNGLALLAVSVTGKPRN